MGTIIGLRPLEGVLGSSTASLSETVESSSSPLVELSLPDSAKSLSSAEKSVSEFSSTNFAISVGNKQNLLFYRYFNQKKKLHKERKTYDF